MTVIDYETFNKLKERMKAKFPILLEGYLRDSKSYLMTIETSVNSDLKALVDAAHSIKSASGLLGILEVHKNAETLEYAGKDVLENEGGNIESLKTYSTNLQNAFSEVEGNLQEELTKAKQASA